MGKWLTGAVVVAGIALAGWFGWDRFGPGQTSDPGSSAVIEQPSGIVVGADRNTPSSDTATQPAPAQAAATGSPADEGTLSSSSAGNAAAPSSAEAEPSANGDQNAHTGQLAGMADETPESRSDALQRDPMLDTETAALAPQDAPSEEPVTPQTDPTAPAGTAGASADEAGQVPSFDVVRIDKDGQMVLAGKASPGDVVEILLDGEVIAETVADGQGGFVAVVFAELSGDHAQQLQLRSALPPGNAGMARSPLAGTAEDPSSSASDPASREPGQAVAPSTLAAALPAPAEARQQSTRVSDAEPEPEPELKPNPDTEPDSTLARPSAALDPAPDDTEPAQAPDAGDLVAAPDTDRAPDQVASIASDAGATPEIGATALQAPGEPPIVAPAVSGARDEPDPGTGAGPSQEPRFALSAPVIILPSGDDNAAPTLVTPQQDDLAILQSGGAAASGVVLDRITYGEDGEVRFRGRGPAGGMIRIYGNAQALGTTRVAADGAWAWSMSRPDAEGMKLFRFDELDTAGKVTSRIETPFQYSSVSPQVLRERRIVVQRGDVLWRIAEQYYGDGIRYSAIYGANTELIRDPDLIYPGQIFSIPELVDAN